MDSLKNVRNNSQIQITRQNISIHAHAHKNLPI